MPGGKRIPSRASKGGKFRITRVHEFRSSSSHDMLDGSIDSACHQMGNERFPAGALETGTPKRITGREEDGAHHKERLALAQLVADIAELGQPRIVKVIDMEIVERPHEARQGGIEFDQPDKREQ